MVVKTKCFGEININEDKILSFENGLFGFEQYKKYTILHNNENEAKEKISWLQCIDEPSLALPMVNPLVVKSDYNPVVSNEALTQLEDLNDENMAMFLIISVPSEVKDMTANLKAPIVINSDTKKGAQVVAENSEYIVKYKIYDTLMNKEGTAC